MEFISSEVQMPVTNFQTLLFQPHRLNTRPSAVLTSARFMSAPIKTSIPWFHFMSLLPFNTFLHNLTLEPFLYNMLLF